MPLDPSIALQGYQPKPFAEQFAPWVNIAAQQQQMQLQRAQLPGVVAEAQEAQRKAKRNAEVERITSSFKKTNADGTLSFDPSAAADALKKAGYYDEGIKIDKDVLDTTAKDLENKLKAIKNPVEAAKFKAEFHDEVFKKIGSTADQLPPGPQRQEYLRNSARVAVERYGVSPDDPRLQLLVPDVGFQPVQPGAAVPQPVPGAEPVPGATAALGNVGRDPYDITNQRMALADQGMRMQAAGFTDQDPKSPGNVRARQWAQSQGFDVSPEDTQFSIATKYPGMAEAIAKAAGGSVLSETTRAQVTMEAAQIHAAMDNNVQAVSQARTMKKDLLATKLGTITGGLWERYIAQNPQLSGLRTAVQAYNARNPADAIDPERLTVGEIVAKLDSETRLLDNKLKVLNKMLGSTRVPKPEAGPAVPPPPAKGTPAVPPAKGTVKMTKTVGGKTHTAEVPASEVQEARAAGWR